MDYSKFEDSIQFAIQREEDAYQGYGDMSEIAENSIGLRKNRRRFMSGDSRGTPPTRSSGHAASQASMRGRMPSAHHL